MSTLQLRMCEDQGGVQNWRWTNRQLRSWCARALAWRKVDGLFISNFALRPDLSACAVESKRVLIRHTSSDMTGGKIRSSAPSSQIPMMFYQKALTGVAGAVFQRVTCRFIGHYLQTWTTRNINILLHNLTSQKHRNSPDFCFGLWAQLKTLWIVGTPTIIIIPRIIQTVSAQHGRLILFVFNTSPSPCKGPQCRGIWCAGVDLCCLSSGLENCCFHIHLYIQLAFVSINRSPVCFYVLVQDAWSHFLLNCTHMLGTWLSIQMCNCFLGCGE